LLIAKSGLAVEPGDVRLPPPDRTLLRWRSAQLFVIGHGFSQVIDERSNSRGDWTTIANENGVDVLRVMRRLLF